MTNDELLAEILPKAFRVEMDTNDSRGGVIRLWRYNAEWHMITYPAHGESISVWGNDTIAAELRARGIMKQEATQA